MTFKEAKEVLKDLRDKDTPYLSLSYRWNEGLSSGPEVTCSAYINGQSFDGPNWEVVIARVKAYVLAMAVKPTLEGAP
jgi:hypothetical protein